MKLITVPIIIIVLSLLAGMYAYQEITEEKIASHWDINGNVKGHMGKFWGIFLFSFVLIGMYVLFLLIPMIDPLKKNIQKFRKYYDAVIVVIFSFLFYILLLTILANLGYSFNMINMLIPGIGLFFFGIGFFMKKLKRNWFIGIRTPWTLSNDKVWKKTHELASILFKITGIIIFLGLFIQTKYFIWLILTPTIITVLVLVLYSYVEYSKIKKKNLFFVDRK